MNIQILANIGNRNLLVKDSIGVLQSINTSEFRFKTEEIWKDFDEYENQIQPAILPVILDKYPEANLYMFVSNQDDLHESDTFFEGLILKRIFSKLYPSLNVRVVELRDAKGGIDPTDDDSLIVFYKNWLNGNVKSWSEDQIVFFDSGGTAQQKASLRAVLEFYISKERLLQFYGRKLGDTTILKELERNAAEKLFQKRQLRTLVEHYNYGAARLLFSEMQEPNNSLDALLLLGDLLWNNMFGEIKQKFHWNSIPKNVKQHRLSKELKELVHPQFEDGFYNSRFAYHASWLYAKTLCALKNGDSTTAIISFMQMIEVFCNGYVTLETEHDLIDSYSKTSHELLNEVIYDYGDEFRRETGRELQKFSIYVTIFYAQKLLEAAEDSSADVLSDLKRYLSLFVGSSVPKPLRLDTIRNKIAHQGKGVDYDSFIAVYADVIEKAESMVGQNKDKFNLLNTIIFDLM